MRRKAAGTPRPHHDAMLPKYTIAVASDLSGVPQQQLRRMEDNGLIAPARTQGNTRRYSDKDLADIAEIAELAEQGANVTSIRRIRELLAQIAALRMENEELRRQLEARAAHRGRRAGAESHGSDSTPGTEVP